MLGLNYVDKFIPILKGKFTKNNTYARELNYKGDIKYSRKETPYSIQ